MKGQENRYSEVCDELERRNGPTEYAPYDKADAYDEGFAAGYAKREAWLRSDEALVAAAIALNSGWHGKDHPCSTTPCSECREDAQRVIDALLRETET